MLRLFFPRIDFSGRMSRLRFWRELAVAGVTAPLVLAILAYLVNEFSVAAAQGLAVDDGRAKALAGAALTFISIRNTVAFWSIVKRRMNDIGYNAGDFQRDTRPLVIAIILTVIGTVGLPLGGISAILFLPVFYILLWQLKKVLTFAWRLIISPSYEGMPGGAVRLGEESADGTNRPDRQFARQFAPWLDQSAGGRQMKETLVTVRAEIERMAADPKAQKFLDLFKSFAAKLPAGRQDLSERPERRSRPAERHERKVTYRSPPTKAVRLAHALPKTGRSSMLTGLLRGPWG